MQNMKVGDIVALVSFGEETRPVKIIGETKNYFKVSLTNLPKGHSSRFDMKRWDEVEHTLDIQMFSKRTGIKKGAGDSVSLRFCPDYIRNLNEVITRMESELKEYDSYKGLNRYREELKKTLAICKKAQSEGLPE